MKTLSQYICESNKFNKRINETKEFLEKTKKYFSNDEYKMLVNLFNNTKEDNSTSSLFGKYIENNGEIDFVFDITIRKHKIGLTFPDKLSQDYLHKKFNVGTNVISIDSNLHLGQNSTYVNIAVTTSIKNRDDYRNGPSIEETVEIIKFILSELKKYIKE